MKGVVLKPEAKVGLADVPEPSLQKNGDVLVNVTTAAICGSDIHVVHGMIPGVPPGTVMGHEFVGVVEDIGADVTRFKPGDRVVGSGRGLVRGLSGLPAGRGPELLQRRGLGAAASFLAEASMEPRPARSGFRTPMSA